MDDLDKFKLKYYMRIECFCTEILLLLSNPDEDARSHSGLQQRLKALHPFPCSRKSSHFQNSEWLIFHLALLLYLDAYPVFSIKRGRYEASFENGVIYLQCVMHAIHIAFNAPALSPPLAIFSFSSNCNNNKIKREDDKPHSDLPLEDCNIAVIRERKFFLLVLGWNCVPKGRSAGIKVSCSRFRVRSVWASLRWANHYHHHHPNAQRLQPRAWVLTWISGKPTS
jgi:hypothetical protein